MLNDAETSSFDRSVTTSPSIWHPSEKQLAMLRRALGDDLVVAADAVRLGSKSTPVANGVLRFIQADGYNDSFAMQWKTFQLTQYDRANGTTLYRDRYRRETGWPTHGLDNELILEAGCGAGAFTCHLQATGADVVSLDYSAAVEVAEAHNRSERALFLQADILNLPFRQGAFDRVFCHGVLQHTPDPESGFRRLDDCLRPGGRISFDVYLKDGRIRPWKSKYLWRPMTTRMSRDRLLRLLHWYIPKWLPIDTRIKRLPLVGNYLGALIPCWNYCDRPLSETDKVTWAIMDTFDALAPRYDLPVRRSDVRRWFESAGYTDFEVHEGGNGVVGNGVKPEG